MSAPEFDKYAEHYRAMHQASIALSGCEPAYFSEYKVAFAASVIRIIPQVLATLRALEPALGWRPIGGQYSLTARRH